MKMSMSMYDLNAAIAEVEMVIDAAESCVCAMAQLISGRLQKSGVDKDALVELKQELQNFNIGTREWRK